MLDSKHNFRHLERSFEWGDSLVLSPLGRIWPFVIWAALLHVSMISLFLWQQKGRTLPQIEELGQPIEIVYLEEKLTLPASTPTKEEKIPEKEEQGRPNPIRQLQAKDTKTEGGVVLPSALKTKPALSLKAGNPHPPYPEYARENSIEGKVVAILKIEASTGGVREVKIAEPRAHGCLEQSVVDTVRNWQFQPFNSPDLIEEIFPFEFHLTEDG